MVLLQTSGAGGFEGFEGLSLLLLIAAAAALVAWALLVAGLWVGTRPRMPRAGASTLDLADESPALVNLLLNRWRLGRSAAAATLTDLAARRVLALEDYAGARHVVRIRSNQPANVQFRPFEQHVMDLVRRRVSGGSAPVEALDLGEAAESQRWWKKFRELVEKEAVEQGYARGRWSFGHRVIVSSALAVVVALAAAAMASAGVGSGGEDPIGTWDWFLFAGIGWLLANGGFKAVHGLRETAKGKEACARWLGVRNALRESAVFPDLPPGAVTVWERYLAYAVAGDLARTVLRTLPFAADDPSRGWSRYGGDWKEVRIRYPRRFGFGQPPWKVFLTGLALSVGGGVLLFLVLPFVVRTAWQLGTDILTDADSFSSRNEMLLIVAIVAAALVPAAYLLYWFVEGAGRLINGARDLNRRVTVTGEVANTYLGRVALSDGRSDRVKAWRPPVGTPTLRRGQLVTVTMTPHLHHVSRIEILQDVPGLLPSEEPVRPVSPSLPPVAQHVGSVLNDGLVSAAIGFPLRSVAEHDNDVVAGTPGLFARTFTDGQDGSVRVYVTPGMGQRATAFLGLFARLPGGETAEVCGYRGSWLGGRILSVPLAGEVLAIDMELPQFDPSHNRQSAIALAEKLLIGASNSPAPPATASAD